MKQRNRIIPLLATIIVSTVAQLGQVAQASPMEGYAIVEDPDGYVNLRAQESLKSTVIQKVPSGSIVNTNCNFAEQENNFCTVLTDQGGFGYIYKDRLSLIAHNDRLKFVPLNKSDNLLTAYYKSDQYGISANLQLKPYTIHPNKFTNDDPETEFAVYYNGVASFGLEGFNPNASFTEKYYKFSEITFGIGDKVISVPAQQLEGIYLSEYEVSNNGIFKYTHLYVNPTTNHLYLVSLRSYGAGTYSLVYEVDARGKVTKHVWSEAI